MHQLNEEVRCLRQTLSHLNYRIKHETDKETKNKLMEDYNSYNLILSSKLKELSDLRTQKEEELETLTNRWMELEEKREG